MPSPYSSHNWKLVLFDHFPPPLRPPPTSDNHKSQLFFYQLGFSGFLFICGGLEFGFDFFSIPHVSEVIQSLSFSDLFHWAQCLPSPTMLLQIARFHNFLWLSTIPLLTYHIFCIDTSPVTHLWHLGCLPVSTFKWCYNGHGGTDTFSSVFISFHFISLPMSGIAGSHVALVLVLEDPP